MTAAIFREQADGSLVCPHRDLSVCPPCAASDPAIVDVVGAHFYVPDPADRAEILGMISRLDAAEALGEDPEGPQMTDDAVPGELPRSDDYAALCIGEAVTLCCGAFVTFHDSTLCCKSCWAEVGS